MAEASGGKAKARPANTEVRCSAAGFRSSLASWLSRVACTGLSQRLRPRRDLLLVQRQHARAGSVFPRECACAHVCGFAFIYVCVFVYVHVDVFMSVYE